MQYKKSFVFYITFVILGTIQAQELRNVEGGRKIIVQPDGSIQDFPNFGVPSDALFDKQDSPGYQPTETNGKYPVFNGTVLPMNNVYVNTEEDARKIFVRRMQIAQEAVVTADQRAKEATQQRLKLEQELQAAQTTKASEEVLRQLNLRLTAARKTEQETQQEATQARQEAGKADELTRKGNYLNTLSQAQRTNTRPTQGSEELDDDFYKNIFMLDESSNRMNTPVQNCQIAYEGKDERTQERRRDLQQQQLFSYTDERLRTYLKDKEYLRCNGFLTALGGFRFLSLQFTFAYPNAREAYGFIEKGSVLIVKLLDGSFVTLSAGQMDKGSYDTTTELLTYQVYYPLERSQIQALRRGEVDSIILFWSTGYEEYPVFNLNFFANQFSCLEK